MRDFTRTFILSFGVALTTAALTIWLMLNGATYTGYDALAFGAGGLAALLCAYAWKER